MIENLWMMSIQSCVLILIVLLLRAVFQRYPKLYTYGLWALVLLRLLCPVFVESSFSLQPDFRGSGLMQRVGQRQDRSFMKNTDPIGALISNTGQDEPTTGEQDIKDSDGNEKSALNSDKRQDIENEILIKFVGNIWINKWIAIMELVYLAGVLLVSAVFLIQYVRMRRCVATAVREKGNVFLSEYVQSPFVMGVIRSRIYLPYHIPENEKRYILKHERAHIRHKDPLIRMLGLFACCLHWWNPLVWLAVHKMNQDMEMFCDETVMAHAPLAERKAYSATLLHFSMRQSGLAVVLSFGESNTEKRVKNVMKKKRRSPFVLTILILIAAGCAVTFLSVPAAKGGSQKNDDEGMDGGSNPSEDVRADDGWDLDYYGHWEVQALAGTANVYALSQEELDDCIGTVIGYGGTSYTCKMPAAYDLYTTRLSVSGYEEGADTEEDFLNNWRITPDSLGLNMDAVPCVTVGISEPDAFGAFFYMKDANTILVYYMGAFFEASRIDHETVDNAVDEAYYEMATDFSKTDVENFAKEVRAQILDHDWAGLSEKIAYPITIAGTTYQNEQELRNSDLDAVVTDDFMDKVRAETCENMFFNWQGIEMGETGEVWFAEVLSEQNGSEGLKIIGINITLEE